MARTLFATSDAETFTNRHHTDEIFYGGGPVVIQPYAPFFDGAIWEGDNASFTRESPFFGQMTEIIGRYEGAVGQFNFDVFDGDTVNYSNSDAAVSIDLLQATQHGGFAEGDHLVDIGNIVGSDFGDVIRGSNSSAYPDHPPDHPVAAGGLGSKPSLDPAEVSFVINNPGNNVLEGGGGNDILEGRGGADVLIGGTMGDPNDGFDMASYESSRAAVTVSLDTGLGTGGDAQGDTLIGIDGLVGSDFNDQLTGDSNGNVLVGGRGVDILDGGGGIDTADYSQAHTISQVPTADFVNVRLGLNGEDGHAFEYQALIGHPQLLSVDTLISIENVIGTYGTDNITGNEANNRLDGGASADILDGGFGDDVLIGGGGPDTVSYRSHDTGSLLLGERDTISLGQNGNDGSYTRGGVFSNFGHPQFQVIEQDTLRGIFNVEGSNRAETINGNEQANVLTGRGGADVMHGFGGADTFVYKLASDSTPTAFDTITDFQHGIDKLDLSALHVRFTNDAVLERGEVHVTFDKANNVTIVEASTAGNTDPIHADLHIELTGLINLTQPDFLL
jgi:Ca2+-binding RTX toxin-like protein